MDPATLAGLAICLLASIFLSITYSALSHFSRSGLDDLARDDEQRREGLHRHVERRHRYQLACFALNSLSNILFVILLTQALLKPQHTVGQVLAALGYSLLFVLVLGEVIPRAWGRGNADRWLFVFFPAVQYIELIVRPLTALLGLVTALVGRVAGVPMGRPEHIELSDEIRSVVSKGDKDGALEEKEREMIASIFELHDVDAAEIMTPRTDMVCIEADASVDEIRTLAVKCGYSRIPVFENTRDNILGIVHVKDLLERGNREAKARDVAQKPYLVPETKSVSELLQELRAQKVHMAIVLDEYGGTAGIVTLEDLVEEIVGEIEDEHDEEPVEELRTLDAHTVECDGRLPIDDLNDALNIRVSEDESYDTVSGFVSAELGHIPATDESFRWRNVEFTVLDATPRTIRRLRVTVHPDHEGEVAE